VIPPFEITPEALRPLLRGDWLHKARLLIMHEFVVAIVLTIYAKLIRS
jgi:hypothetical protein